MSHISLVFFSFFFFFSVAMSAMIGISHVTYLFLSFPFDFPAQKGTTKALRYLRVKLFTHSLLFCLFLWISFVLFPFFFPPRQEATKKSLESFWVKTSAVISELSLCFPLSLFGPLFSFSSPQRSYKEVVFPLLLFFPHLELPKIPCNIIGWRCLLILRLFQNYFILSPFGPLFSFSSLQKATKRALRCLRVRPSEESAFFQNIILNHFCPPHFFLVLPTGTLQRRHGDVYGWGRARNRQIYWKGRSAGAWHMNESCRKWMSHVADEGVMSQMNESCRIWVSHAVHECVMWHRCETCHMEIAKSAEKGEVQVHDVWTSHVASE